mmetsp:Transcript_32543/g.55490  ORF Transcript_32543/g.55490 Transcript_32543/m.55490 type:complete len:82 (+) Transcript_32543:2179-2424(+)
MIFSTSGKNVRLRIYRLKLGAMLVSENSYILKHILFRYMLSMSTFSVRLASTAQRRGGNMCLLASMNARLVHRFALDRVAF